MSLPVSLAGTLRYTANPGQPEQSVAINISMQYTKRSEALLPLTGSGTKDVDFGEVVSPGAKAVVVLVDADPTGAAQPIMCRYNGGTATGQKEVSPGGAEILLSPNPSAGITELSIVHTSSVTVRVWIFG